MMILACIGLLLTRNFDLPLILTTLSKNSFSDLKSRLFNSCLGFMCYQNKNQNLISYIKTALFPRWQAYAPLHKTINKMLGRKQRRR